MPSTPLQLWCAGAEAAGQGLEVPGGGEEEQRELRTRSPRHHQLQLKVKSTLQNNPYTFISICVVGIKRT